jgi:Fe-S-cluster containining protein
MNFDKFFQQYEDVVQQVENTFEKVKNEYNDCVNCKVGCADCCHALFDLTLIEALYVKAKFDATYQGEEKEALLERANRADRAIHKLKRKAYKEYESGRSEREILEEMSEKRERCPLLNDDQRCDLYAYRPITCRLYGVPSQVGEKAHCCPLSGFEPGRSYPSVKIDQIQKRLYQISAELAREIRSRYPELAQMLVPLSMALLTDYTEDYLGVRQEPSPDENQTSE